MSIKSKKLVQVPMGKELINDLIKISKETGESRAEIIRKACRVYIDMMKEKRLEEIYVKGYIDIPETQTMAKVSSELVNKVSEKEEW